jgi:hypothetical protein
VIDVRGAFLLSKGGFGAGRTLKVSWVI